MKKPSCHNPECSLYGNVESTRIIRYGFYRTTAGKRRRYRCVGCGQTFSTTKGTPYYRLQHRRTTFDTVVTLRVEGVSLSAIARAERLAWNTVARWLERAGAVCRRFNHGRTTGFAVEELQADEIRSFTGGKTRPTWVFAAIEVWSRLWTSTVVGRRSYRNTLALVRDVASRMTFTTCPVIVTDGFEFYGTVIRPGLRSGGALCAGDQDPPPRSRGASRTARGDWRPLAVPTRRSPVRRIRRR